MFSTFFKSLQAVIFSLFFANVANAVPEQLDIQTVIRQAEAGDAEAQSRLSEAYLRGNNGVEQDYERAVWWIKRALVQGNGRAMTNLGLLSMNGQGMEKEYVRAWVLFTKGMEAGDTEAARYLGMLYEHGLGVAQDYAKAVESYQTGSERGDIISQYRLAKLYEQGLGVERDFQKAIALYRKHEARVEPVTAASFIALGDIYALGLSVEKDVPEAKKWYQLAVQAGNQVAQEKLAKLN